MEKYIYQWINQETQIIEYIKGQITDLIRKKVCEEKKLRYYNSKDNQKRQRRINHLKYINKTLQRHYLELLEAYNNINEFIKEIRT
jgi:competence CoiA-like predicted nuclease